MLPRVYDSVYLYEYLFIRTTNLFTVNLFTFRDEYGMSPKLYDEFHMTSHTRSNRMHSGIIEKQFP